MLISSCLARAIDTREFERHRALKHIFIKIKKKIKKKTGEKHFSAQSLFHSLCFVLTNLIDDVLKIQSNLFNLIVRYPRLDFQPFCKSAFLGRRMAHRTPRMDGDRAIPYPDSRRFPQVHSMPGY